MFGINKNQSQGSQNPTQAAPANQEAITIHTMADDLTGTSGTVVAAQAQPQPQAESPFGTQSAPIASAPAQPQPTVAKAAPVVTPVATPQSTRQVLRAPQQVSQHSPQAQATKSGVGWAVVLAIVLIILAVAAFFLRDMLAGYISPLFSSSKVTETAVPLPQQQVETSAGVQDTTTDGPVSFGQLTVYKRAIAVTQETTTTAFGEMFASAMTTTDGMPVVITVQENGDDMAFNDFAARFLPQAPAGILPQLSEPFQIMILPEADNTPRVALHTTSTDAAMTRTAVRAAENNLFTMILPILPFQVQMPMAMTFQDGVYNGIPVRYYNFTPTASQSVDYVTHYQHLFIGTSRTTMHQAMDAVFAQESIDAAASATVDDAAMPALVAPGTGPAPMDGTDSMADAPVATDTTAASPATTPAMNVPTSAPAM